MRHVYSHISLFEMGVVACCVTLLTTGSAGFAMQAAQFENATDSAGIDYVGQSFGVSWGDVNGDGWPDAWVGNHSNTPALYVNNTDGTFSNEIFRVNYNFSDRHGAAWADFDNDGDQDLITLAGAQSGFGVGTNQLFVNMNGVLDDQAAALGLSYSLGRGRTPLWFDWNNDGELDVFLSNWSRVDGQAPSALFSQMNGRFSDSIGQTNLAVTGNSFAQLLTVGYSGSPLLVLAGSPYPDRVYNWQSIPFVDQTSLFALTDIDKWKVVDAAIADFNGDNLSDVFLVRIANGSQVIQTKPNDISAKLIVNASEKAFTFGADGLVQFEIGPSVVVAPSDIYIGSAGVHPSSQIFSVSSLDVNTAGLMPHQLGVDSGIYIGFDAQAGLWRVAASSGDWLGAGIAVAADTAISSLANIGFENSDGAANDKLFLQSATGFQDYSVAAGLNSATACRSAVAADFDNDMDVDLYLVCSSPTGNSANLLYENLGGGQFQLVPGAGGASGSSLGLADSAATADYDRDGYMDIFVTNGYEGTPFNRGPSQLFRNLGGNNHWLEIDLVGVISNRDAVGARVALTAAGVTQVRDRDGGMHSFSQNDTRLHFGLAGATVVDTIDISWPSGVRQVLSSIGVDQIIKVKEGSNQIAANQPPAISSIQSQVTQEDTATEVLPFNVSDSETDPAFLIVTATSSDQVLVPDADLVLGGSGSDRTILVTPAPGRNGGPVAITVIVSDGKDSASTTFDLTVQAVNDSPVARSDDAFVRIGEIINIPVAANDEGVDNSLDMGGIDIVDGPQRGSVSINNDGSISYFNTSLNSTNDSFTYTIKDVSGAVSNVATVRITINPLLDGAGNVISFAEAVGRGLDPNVSDGDTDGDGLPDIIEVGGDIANPLDSDYDGVIDAIETGGSAADATVIDGLALPNGAKVRISTTGGEALSRAMVVPVELQPLGTDFSFGAISYSATAPKGGSVGIVMVFSRELPRNLVVYKLDGNGSLVELPTAMWRQTSATTIELSVTDGDPLTDMDAILNGNIDDPIAIGNRNTLPVTGQGGGGGCLIAQAQGADPMLPILLGLAIVGLLRRYPLVPKRTISGNGGNFG